MPSAVEAGPVAAVRGRLLRFGLIVAAAVLVADQISKWVILEKVMQPPRVIEVTSFFNLRMAWNTGVSFGMFGDGGDVGRWVLTVFPLAITAFLLNWLRQAERRILALALGLVIGGAIGNVIDRVRFGAVADFLDFHLFGWHFWTFNVADSAISIGVALLLYDSVFGPDSGKAPPGGTGGENQ